MKSVATDKLTTANLHKCVNQDKMIKTEHTLVLKMLNTHEKGLLIVQDQVVGSRMKLVPSVNISNLMCGPNLDVSATLISNMCLIASCAY